MLLCKFLQTKAKEEKSEMKTFLILFLSKTGRPLLELDEEEGGGVTIYVAITAWMGGEGGYTG